MSGVKVKVSVKLKHGVPEFQASILRWQMGLPDKNFDAVRTQWLARYSSFIRRRFMLFSRGGGTWAPLAKSTVEARAAQRRGFKARGRQRARVKYGRVTSILYNTGVLFNSLTIGHRGNKTETVPGGVRFGFARFPHRDRKGRFGTTVDKIAAYHQTGGGRLPQRKILVSAPHDLTQAMASDFVRASRRAWRDAHKGEA